MKHAGPTALDQLEPLLSSLRALPGLKETARGVFYRRGRAFLHFHEDPAGLFADLRLEGADFDRLAVSSLEDQARLLKQVQAALPSG